MKKLLLIFITFSFRWLTIALCVGGSLFTCLQVQAQGLWTPRASLPDSARGEGISFTIGNYGYVGLGENFSYYPFQFYKDFWRFDPANDSWTRMADFPGKTRVLPATFVIGHYGYVVCGDSAGQGSTLYNECWRYDAYTDTWTQKANFGGAARAYACGFAIGAKGYVGLGVGMGFYKDFWAYDTATNTWTQITDFGIAGRICTSAFAIGGKGYVCFGQDSSYANDLKNEMWVYDTATNSWAQKTSNPGQPFFGTCGFVIGTNIYVGTGQDDGATDYSTFWKYNTMTDTWIKQANFTYATFGGFAFAIGDTGYMGLGWDTIPPEYNSNTWYKFYPDTLTALNEIPFTKNNIIIYPNPFKTQCHISLPADKVNSVPEFNLYTITGRKMNVTITKLYNTYLMKIEDLPSGIYILSIQCKSQIFNKKVIIIH